MFTTVRRQQLLDELTTRASSDDTVTAAALVGSHARRDTDRWSDIDLALRLRPGLDPVVAADSWGSVLAADHAVADQLDLWSGSALYRVFLFADSLQVDLSFWPADDFASNGEAWTLLFGTSGPEDQRSPADPREIIGWAWLYALHTRSAIARGRGWQALHMMDGLRDRVLTLACLRHGLPAHQGRGLDQLPATVLAPYIRTLVSRPDHHELGAAFDHAVSLLLDEVAQLDSELAARLGPPLVTLVDTARSAGATG